MEKVKIALLGAGNIGHVHLAACKNAENAEIAGVYDVVSEFAEKAADEYGVKAYASAEALLEDRKIDGVVIAVPNDRHDLLAKMAAEYGKSILCEKPMSLSAERAQEMVDCCKKNKVHLQMGFCNRYLPETEALISYIQSGDLGDIYFAMADTLRQRGMPIGWFSDIAKSGGGPLIDIGVHVIDVAWYLMGRPHAKYAKALHYHVIPERIPESMERYLAYEKGDVMNVEDSSHGLITFENGRGLAYQAAWSINAESHETLSLYGERAGASLWPAKIIRCEHGRMAETTPMYRQADCYQRQLEHFARVIREEEVCRAPGEDGVAIQQMLDALYRSAKSGKEESV